MSAKRSNSRTGRKPMSAYAKLRKQHYDKQYRLDIAIFGHSRLFERMREAGRLSDDGQLIQRRNYGGQFSTGYQSRTSATPEELNHFLDDLVCAPSTIRFCRTCRQTYSKCVCWNEFSRFDFKLVSDTIGGARVDDGCFPTTDQMLEDLRDKVPGQLFDSLFEFNDMYKKKDGDNE